MLIKNGGAFLTLVSLLLPAFVACGETDDPKPIARTELAKTLADVICNNIGPCCRAVDIPQNPELCNVNARTSFQAAIDEIMASGRVHYDPAQAGKCVEGYKAVIIACQGDDEFAEDSCEGMFVGTQPVGGECNSSQECAPVSNGSAYCDRDDDGQGHCTADGDDLGVHAKLGASCNTSCSSDGDGTSCGGVSGGGPAIGTCYDSDGLYCDFQTNKCANLPENRASVLEFVSERCLLCLRHLQAKISEGSCEGNFDACADGSYCNNFGECEPMLKIGAACEEDFDMCADGSRCENGICRARTIASEALCSGKIGD